MRETRRKLCADVFPCDTLQWLFVPTWLTAGTRLFLSLSRNWTTEVRSHFEMSLSSLTIITTWAIKMTCVELFVCDMPVRHF